MRKEIGNSMPAERIRENAWRESDMLCNLCVNPKMTNGSLDERAARQNA
jgi:hypothetical protein